MAWRYFPIFKLERSVNRKLINMFIPLNLLKEKYHLNLENILHVGAHEAQELNDYIQCGAKKIHWVEANTELANKLSDRLDKSIHKVTNAVVSNEDDMEVLFKIANNTQSSSILDLGEHSNLFPDIYYTHEEKRLTKTLNSILIEDKFLDKINFLNIDIQGAELLALQGLSNHLDFIESIYIEINDSQVYKNCSQTNEIDEFLNKFNFERKEKYLYSNHPWGDAFYLKKHE
jgi:FkbM family methyltransferase